jgi:hypothetical protein
MDRMASPPYALADSARNRDRGGAKRPNKRIARPNECAWKEPGSASPSHERPSCPPRCRARSCTGLIMLGKASRWRTGRGFQGRGERLLYRLDRSREAYWRDSRDFRTWGCIPKKAAIVRFPGLSGPAEPPDARPNPGTPGAVPPQTGCTSDAGRTTL